MTKVILHDIMATIRMKKTSNMPKMAWLCSIDKNEIDIIYGNNVQYTSNRGGELFEGTYVNYSKNKQLFDIDNIYMGSGIINFNKYHQGRNKNHLIVICPSHIFDYVWIIHNKQINKIFVSNSLYCCIAASTFNCNDIKSIKFREIFKGFGNFNRILFENDQFEVLVGCNNFFTIQNDEIKTIEQTHNTDFKTFEEYHSFLKDTISKLYDNIMPKSTILYLSKGYDSVCCGTLLYELKIKNVKAICRREDRHHHDDDGRDIARIFNFDIIELNPPERPFTIKNVKGSNDTYCLYEIRETDLERIKNFVVPWQDPHDEAMYCDEIDYDNSIVITGFHGDVIWGLGETDDNFERLSHDLGGTAISEYRLRTGFIHVPVPGISNIKHSNLKQISKSKEMREYNVPSEYNRPIPRRIAECYGHLKRGSFATMKSAILSQFSNFTEELKYQIIEDTIKEYKNAIRDNNNIDD